MVNHGVKPGFSALSEGQWRDLAKGILKAELKRQNLTYGDLAEKLVKIGVEENEASIRNKISRGAFTFVFALQAIQALELNFSLRRKPSEGHTIDLPTGNSIELSQEALEALKKMVLGD